MISRQDLLEAIAECNGVRNPNANTCIMLAAFYTILDHMDDSEVKPTSRYSFSAAPEPVAYESGTEFGREIAGRDMNKVLGVVDELMTALQVVNPRLYDGVMIKIAE